MPTGTRQLGASGRSEWAISIFAAVGKASVSNDKALDGNMDYGETQTRSNHFT